MILLGLSTGVPMVKAQATPQIVLAPTKLPEQTVGQTFTVTVNLTDFPDLAGYQVVFKYNGTVLNMTGVTFPSDYVLSGQLTQTLPPPIDSEERGDVKDGSNWTMAGAVLVGSGSVAVSNGILLEMNFTVIGVGQTTITLATTTDPVYYAEGPLFGTFYTDLQDVNFNDYYDFPTQGLTILCGIANAAPLAYFTVSSTAPPGGSKTNDLLYANPPNGIVSGQTCWLSEPVVFNASLSYAPTGNITAYVWNFGDGNITVVNATAPDAWLITHVYRTTGPLEANLTVLSSQLGNSSQLNSGSYQVWMLVGEALQLYDWTPFLTAFGVIIVVAIVLAAARSVVLSVRRRRKLKMQARLTAAPPGQSSTGAKTT
jgi:hypothetical protein